MVRSAGGAAAGVVTDMALAAANAAAPPPCGSRAAPLALLVQSPAPIPLDSTAVGIGDSAEVVAVAPVAPVAGAVADTPAEPSGSLLG